MGRVEEWCGVDWGMERGGLRHAMRWEKGRVYHDRDAVTLSIAGVCEEPPENCEQQTPTLKGSPLSTDAPPLLCCWGTPSECLPLLERCPQVVPTYGY